MADDVRNWNSVDDLRVQISSELATDSWSFGVPFDEALYLKVLERPSNVSVFSNGTRSFLYLCAERLGPRGALRASPLPPEELEVGVRGEHCAQVIATLGGKPIEPQNRLHPEREDGAPALLTYEVERWLREIARPVELQALQQPQTQMAALQYRVPGGEWVGAPNMGFGVSYALPIILGGLICSPGGLLIVENPEAHLHPAGQSRMGSFLAWLAGRGVQVVVETHSDHIMNGVRRAIGDYRYLPHDKAGILFFDVDTEDTPEVRDLRFTEIGGIDHWPTGFFDQYQVDVASLGRVRRRQ